MTPKVEFLFDFGSPNAYLAHKIIPQVEARTRIRFTYVPVLLGGIFKLTGNRSPVEAFAAVKNKREFMLLEMNRFVKKHRLTAFTHNPHFPVNTLALMRCAAAARIDGNLERLVEAAFHHMWEEPKKMDDPAVMREALSASGLDADRLVACTQNESVKAALIAETQRAVDRGAFGAPTFFVDGEMFYGKDQLRDVEEEITARLRRAT